MKDFFIISILYGIKFKNFIAIKDLKKLPFEVNYFLNLSKQNLEFLKIFFNFMCSRDHYLERILHGISLQHALYNISF